MKFFRYVLVIITGLLLSAGYIATRGERMWSPPSLLVGLMFGCSIVWNLLASPDRTSSRPNIILIALIMAGLNLWAALDDKFLDLIWTLAWSILFTAAYFTCAWLHHRQTGISAKPG